MSEHIHTYIYMNIYIYSLSHMYSKVGPDERYGRIVYIPVVEQTEICVVLSLPPASQCWPHGVCVCKRASVCECVFV
jgi:hypothetical protein